MFDHSIFKEGLYNIDIMITKILKAYLKNIDPTDVPRNKRMMSAFIALFKEVADKMPPAEAKVGFFAITLHRIFSYYFTRLILQNFMKENTIGKKPKDVFLEIFRRFVEIPPGQNA